MNLHNVENELNRMRAESLGDTGRKIELLNAMMARLKRRLKMQEAISHRIEGLLSVKIKRRKRRQLMTIKKRLAEKALEDEKQLAKMQAHKDMLIHNFKIQREALGITDHSWLDRLE